ncbi:glycosyltransferase family 8 C-terminal domain-containing protein, partial [Escherichia coli]|uniref:glycosyltransferase family 8 C-terminal domain-containing protein n=1 Tax=Escherichia coli TaxID=562 RepID=UPI002378CD12
CIHLNLMIFTKIIRGFIRAGYPSASYFNIAREQSPWKKYPLKEARTVAEMQKQYKHLFAHGEYIKGITSLIKYKLKK